MGFDITVETKHCGLASIDDTVRVSVRDDWAGLFLELASEEVVPGLVTTVNLVRFGTNVARVKVTAILVFQRLYTVVTESSRCLVGKRLVEVRRFKICTEAIN